MLGDVVRETRIKRGLTQAKLARLAGVSRRHLAALEKGANVSVLVLRKVASVLDLNEIELGDSLQLRTSRTAGKPNVNVAVLADTIREARADASRAQTLLAHAEGLLTGNDGGPAPQTKFPRLPVRHVPSSSTRAATTVHERPDWLEVKTSGELRQGKPIDESKTETVTIPSPLIEKGEIIVRARGTELHEHGIEDGDLLILQLRQKGRAATGELAIGKIGNDCYVGRWWEKHGRKALMSDGMAEVTVGRSRRTLKVVAVVNAIVREDEKV
jgi:transcriptional regulator with XRE-family HTH domain